MALNTHALLRSIVHETRCLPNWSFVLSGSSELGLVLGITIDGVNNYDRDQPFCVTHCHPVPTATYNESTWRRWILEQYLRTMNHELGETLRFGPQEVRPFAPLHGPGEDPYTIHEYVPEVDALTRQDGSIRPGPV